MKHSISTLALLVLGVGCGNDGGTHGVALLTADELLEDPSAFEERRVQIALEDDQVTLSIGYTAAGCPANFNGPCNNAVGQFQIEAADNAVSLVAADDYTPPTPAFGFTPLNSPNFAGRPIRVGCHGNDKSMVCAPSVPSALLVVEGIVQQGASGGSAEYELVVNRVEYDSDVTEETDSESSIQLENASLYEPAPSNCMFRCELIPRESNE